MNLRQIVAKDQREIIKIYFNSINSIEDNLYSKKQKLAWCSQAWKNSEFRKTIINGKGWIVEDDLKKLGFAIRYPLDRLSLFYCLGESRRKGYGSILLNQIEYEALSDNVDTLKTEASLISYRLLLKRDWEILSKETIIINDTSFDRYKMIKRLK